MLSCSRRVAQPAGRSGAPASTGGGGAVQVPGTPPAFILPVQVSPSPAVQVPLFPVPQQGWPAAPQAPHWVPVAERMQASAAVQAVGGAPPSGTATLVGQQSWPAPPQTAHMPGTPMPALRPPQASPAVVQVPPLPTPQHGWPRPPQAPH